MIIVQIAGRLGRDAETRFTQTGQKVTNLTLATNVRKGGKDETVWWRVTLWGEQYDKMLPYLKKGTALIVVGEMNKPEIWTDKEGRPQVNLELNAQIVKFSPFGNPDQRSEQQPGSAQPAANSYAPSSGGSYGAEPDFGMPNPGYGSTSQQGTGSRYNQNTPSEEPLPF